MAQRKSFRNFVHIVIFIECTSMVLSNPGCHPDDNLVLDISQLFQSDIGNVSQSVPDAMQNYLNKRVGKTSACISVFAFYSEFGNFIIAIKVFKFSHFKEIYICFNTELNDSTNERFLHVQSLLDQVQNLFPTIKPRLIFGIR